MLLASSRNTILFALGCLVLTIALFDDTAPGRLTDNADAVARRRASEAALADGASSSVTDESLWESDPVVIAGSDSESLGSGAPEGETVVTATPAAPVAEQPAAPEPARPAASGERERSAPLGRNHADDGARNMAEDLRRALG